MFTAIPAEALAAQATRGAQSPALQKSEGSIGNSASSFTGGGELCSGFGIILESLGNLLQAGKTAGGEGANPSIPADLSQKPKASGTDKDGGGGVSQVNPALLAILKSIVSDTLGTETEAVLPTSDTKDAGKAVVDNIPAGPILTRGKGGEPDEKADLLMHKGTMSTSGDAQSAKADPPLQTKTGNNGDEVFPSYLKQIVTNSEVRASDGKNGAVMEDRGGSVKIESGQIARSEHPKPQDSTAWKEGTIRIETSFPQNAKETETIEGSFHGKGDTNALHNQDGHAQGNTPFAAPSHYEIAGQPLSRPEIPTPVVAKSTVSDVSESRIYVMKDSNTLVVTLEPEGLGKLDINLSLDRGMINAQINVSDSAVRSLIEKNVEQIIHTLLNEGIAVGGFSVTLRDGQEPGRDQLDGRALQEGAAGTAGDSREVSAITYGTGLNAGKGRINLYI